MNIIDTIKTHKPKTVYDLKELAIRVKPIGSGAYRKAYRIIDTDIVIKFPDSAYLEEWEGGEDNAYNECLDHARQEIKVIRRIETVGKYKGLRPLLPNVYYTNMRHGVIAMEYCKPLRYSSKNQAISSLISQFAYAIATGKDNKGWDDYDIRRANIGINNNGAYKIIDLGLFDDR